MNKCETFKELILTDYIDGQLQGSVKTDVEEHLRHCPACQAFFLEVKNNLVVPFEKVPRQTVPNHLWGIIEERIRQGYSRVSALDFLWGWMEGLTFPRLVPAMATLAMVVLIGSTIFVNQQVKQAQDQEGGMYLAYILSPLGVSAPVNNSDLGTPIEQYFFKEDI